MVRTMNTTEDRKKEQLENRNSLEMEIEILQPVILDECVGGEMREGEDCGKAIICNGQCKCQPE